MIQKTPIFTTFLSHPKMDADKRGQIEVFGRIYTYVDMCAFVPTLEAASFRNEPYTAYPPKDWSRLPRFGDGTQCTWELLGAMGSSIFLVFPMKEGELWSYILYWVCAIKCWSSIISASPVSSTSRSECGTPGPASAPFAHKTTFVLGAILNYPIYDQVYPVLHL